MVICGGVIHGYKWTGNTWLKVEVYYMGRGF